MSIIRSNFFDPFAIDEWNPFEDFFSSGNNNRSLSFPRFNFPGEASAFVNTRIDWKETDKAHVFQADMPGMKKEEVKVEVEEGRVLQISGERNRDLEEKNDRWHRVERSSGKFLRRIRLPENAKVDNISAKMDSGVLTVTIPKEEVKKLQVKSIEISGSSN